MQYFIHGFKSTARVWQEPWCLAWVRNECRSMLLTLAHATFLSGMDDYGTGGGYGDDYGGGGHGGGYGGDDYGGGGESVHTRQILFRPFSSHVFFLPCHHDHVSNFR